MANTRRKIKVEIVAGDPRTIDRDKKVPLKVRGLFHLIVSLPMHRQWSVQGLAKMVPDDVYVIEACMELLKEYGYAKRIRVVDRDTKLLKYYKWIFYESGPLTTIEAPTVRAVQTLLTGFDPRPGRGSKRMLKHAASPIVPAHANIIYRISWGIETLEQIRVLSSADRGRVSSILGRIKDSGGDLNDLNYFEDWWKKNWRSRDRVSNQYSTPRPEQILEHWWTAYRDREDRRRSTHAYVSANNNGTVDPDKLHEIMRSIKARK